MILFCILTILTSTNGAVAPLSDLLPPDFPDSPSIAETSARLQGFYVPDNLEKRYDDGSDKSPSAPVPLANSPYGPVPAGSGLEGQYVQDNLEKRYDDGSDKSPPAPVPLANSPYGPVPAGSGLEGQYVADNLEKRYDPGLYNPDGNENRYDRGLYNNENNLQPKLVQTQLGLVPAGSGLEGQYADSKNEEHFDPGLYVDTQLEKLFNDGLVRGELGAVEPYNLNQGGVKAF